MAEVLDVRGFQLEPNVLGRFALGRKLGQQQLQQQQQDQISKLLGQAVSPGRALVPGQPQEAISPGTPQAGTPQIDIPADRSLNERELIERSVQINPVIAASIMQKLGLDTASKRAEASRFAASIQGLPVEIQNQQIDQRAVEIKARGGNPADTLQLREAEGGTRQQILTAIQLADLSTKERFSVQAKARQATQRAFAPITIVNAAGEKRLVSPTVDTLSGKASLSPFDIPEGFHISTETAEEKRAADVVSKQQQEAAKITGKGQAERRQKQIDDALDAAEGMANVQRAFDLLDLVETGGIDVVSLRAKQIFGVEGANEAELSNRMGKAVLTQLRTIFGAAFTEKEGRLLIKIEAGFGKSTKGNKRLLGQAKRVIQRVARRGIRAARAENDFETAREIQEALDFRLDVGPSQTALTSEQRKARITELRRKSGT